MKESSIIEFIKQGMRQARFQDMRKRQASRMLHEAEHPEKYEPIFTRNKVKSNSINITLNFLKKHWTAGDAELDQQIKILSDNNIIKNVDTVFDIQSEAPAVEILSFLNFWKDSKLTNWKSIPLKKINKYFTFNDGQIFNYGSLKELNSRNFQDGDYRKHERYLYFEKILRK